MSCRQAKVALDARARSSPPSCRFELIRHVADLVVDHLEVGRLDRDGDAADLSS